MGRLGEKAKAEPGYRFYALIDKVYPWDILLESWRRVRANGGAPGTDGRTIEDIEAAGVEEFLREIQEALSRPTSTRFRTAS